MDFAGYTVESLSSTSSHEKLMASGTPQEDNWVRVETGALSVLVEGKILGSRHRHANDTNLHEK
ncbi:hypothetical protein J6590_107005, partial [Homalodisca vitripennis]